MNTIERLVRSHTQGKPTTKGTLQTREQREAYWQRMEAATREQRESDEQSRRQSWIEAQSTMLSESVPPVPVSGDACGDLEQP